MKFQWLWICAEPRSRKSPVCETPCYRSCSSKRQSWLNAASSLLPTAALNDEYEIRPLIDHKVMWRQERQDQNYDPKAPITCLLNDGVQTDSIVYDERVCVLRTNNSGRWRSVDSK